jgi:hypothetical protein
MRIGIPKPIGIDDISHVGNKLESARVLLISRENTHIQKKYRIGQLKSNL